MKKASKEISVASKGSIAGLKALLAEEKAARAGKVTSTPASRPFTTVSNKGTHTFIPLFLPRYAFQTQKGPIISPPSF